MSFSLFGALAKLTGANFGTAAVTKGNSSGSTTTLLAPGKSDVTLQTGNPTNALGQSVSDAAVAMSGAPAMPDATLAASLAAKQAGDAAARARKRAMGGDSLLLAPSGSPTPTAVTQPRSLLGY